MNAAGMGIFEVGNEIAMADFLLKFWGNITTKNIWKVWDEGLIHGAFNESGLFDDSPLYNLLSDVFGKSPKGV